MQTLPVNNSTILRIKNAEFSGYHFYINKNMKWFLKTMAAVFWLSLNSEIIGAETNSESYQTSKIERFAKTINGYRKLWSNYIWL